MNRILAVVVLCNCTRVEPKAESREGTPICRASYAACDVSDEHRPDPQFNEPGHGGDELLGQPGHELRWNLMDCEAVYGEGTSVHAPWCSRRNKCEVFEEPHEFECPVDRQCVVIADGPRVFVERCVERSLHGV